MSSAPNSLSLPCEKNKGKSSIRSAIDSKKEIMLGGEGRGRTLSAKLTVVQRNAIYLVTATKKWGGGDKRRGSSLLPTPQRPGELAKCEAKSSAGGIVSFYTNKLLQKRYQPRESAGYARLCWPFMWHPPS